MIYTITFTAWLSFIAFCMYMFTPWFILLIIFTDSIVMYNTPMTTEADDSSHA